MADSIRKKVMWVEDDKLLGSILANAIATKGFDLKVALTGREAMEILKDYIPDVLMVDLYLPGDMNGYDVLERAAADPRFKGVPTIILSNFGRSEHFGKAHPMEATKYLLKADVSIAQITDALQEVTSK
jgi:DNA-binding response OmpR family regulator